eukprot:scaffold46101_cov21-Tisochrysis_lutea.AAC.2
MLPFPINVLPRKRGRDLPHVTRLAGKQMGAGFLQRPQLYNKKRKEETARYSTPVSCHALLESCCLHVLLSAQVPYEADYVGYLCPNKWVVGNGMDTAQIYRCAVLSFKEEQCCVY